jgi:cytochrome c553
VIRRATVAGLLVAAAFTAATAAQAQSPAQIRAGQEKSRSCMVCHGQLGISNIPNAPHLAGQPAIYLVEQMKAYRSGKRANEVMAVIARPLSDADIDDLAAWYASIRIEAFPPN